MHRLDLALVGRRRGFTLVEMLVVLALMLVLAALAVAFVPRMTERAKVPRGASQLQMWLMIARQWAKRDNIPTGIRLQAGRLYPSPATFNPAYVSDLQYIQQPPIYYAPGSQLTIITGRAQTLYPPPYDRDNSPPGPTWYSTYQNNIVKGTLTGGALLDFYAGAMRGLSLDPTYDWTLGPTYVLPDSAPRYQNQTLWPVQPGDYLQWQDATYRIDDVVPDPTDVPPDPLNPPGDLLVLSRQPVSGVDPTYYKIIRGPRILPGEQGLQMPQDVAIDANTNAIFGNTLPTNPFTGDIDILFSPSGEVISRGLSTDKIIFWVRDVTQDTTVSAGNIPPGDQSLIVVYARTGFIAAHNVYSGVNTLGTTDPSLASPTGMQLNVADPTGINIGDYLIIDTNTFSPSGTQLTYQETQQVIGVNGSTITFGQMMFSHLAGKYRVISDPYSYVRNAKSSGM